MRIKSNSLLAVLMAVMLILGLTPSTAFAADQKATPGTVTLTGISAPTYNKINIRWNRTSNATHYKIYYKKTGSSQWTGLATVSGNTTSYTHTSSKTRPIVVGQKYTYTVKGYNSKYNTNGHYNARGLTVQTKPSTVQLSRATLASNKQSVTVSWNRASGCNYYCVFRKTPSTGWKRLANLRSPQTSYIDRNPVKGQRNIYTVRSYYSPTRMYGNYNPSGISVNVPSSGSTGSQRLTPGTVTLSKISAPAYNKINIQWKPASNATHYKIYYKKSASSQWIGLATVSGNTTSYTHTNSNKTPIIPGQKYTYTVKGYNSKYNTNGPYNSKGLTISTKLDTVKLKNAVLSKDQKSVTVSWNGLPGNGFYYIYRKTPSTGWKQIGLTDYRFNSYVDKNPIKGQKNIYTVRAYVVFSNTYGGYDPKGVSVNVPSKPTPHKHSYTSSITRQPTCSKEGVRTYKCSCGHSYTKSIPATRKHVWEDLGSDVRLDWSGSLQENTGPTQNAFKVSAANFCTGCGYYYGTGINDNFDIRYFDHLDNPNSEHCLGGYTLLHIYEIHHLLECRNCNISKCGKFSHYQYTFTWYGHNDKIKLEDWQIKELVLPLDGTVKVTL